MQYNKTLKQYARNLRNNSTPGEIKLWSRALKAKKMMGFSFLRQHPMDNYIMDFVCRKLKLVIEIDGKYHTICSERDLAKNNYIHSIGYSVLRFTEADIKYRIDDVVATIQTWIIQNGNIDPDNERLDLS